MAAGRHTSRVFQVGEKLKAKLDTISFSSFQGRIPEPTMGAVDPDQDREQIGVVLTPQETVAEWVNMSPAGRDEIIGFDVVHLVMNPNIKTPDDVWQRMEEIAGLIQSAVYNTTTEAVVTLGFDGEIPTGRVRSVRPEVGPSGGGFVGRCVVSFEFRARI